MAIERERERPARALVVPRLLLVVHPDQEDTVPGALLHRDLGAEGLHEAVPFRGREPSELDVGALGPDRRHLRVGVLDDECAVAVEIGLALVPVIGVLPGGPVCALHVLDEDEGARAHDVRLVPVHVLRQDVGPVDPVEGRGESGDERRRRPLEAEHDRGGVRGLHRLDGRVLAFAERDDARGRKDDLVVGRLHVLRGQVAAVVELHPATEPERVGPAVPGDRPRLGEVTHHPRPRTIGGIEPEERIVNRSDRVDERERPFAVPVVGCRLGRDDEHELATVARPLLRARAGAAEHGEHQSGDTDHETAHGLGAPAARAIRRHYSVSHTASSCWFR